ncbi:MAG: CHASE2 domain-containing protein [Phormidesmis sp.]
MRLRRFKQLNRLIPGVLVSALVILLMQVHAWTLLEYKISDQFLRWHGPTPWDKGIVAIQIDDKSISQMGPLPLSNRDYAALVDILRQEKTSVVAFNLLVLDGAAANDNSTTVGEANNPFAAAMRSHGRVVIGQGLTREGKAISPVSALADTAIATGHLRLQSDLDNITRWVDLTLDNIPTLGVAAVQAYSLEDRLVSIPSDMGRMRIHWPGPTQELPLFSFIDVLSGQVSPDYLQDKIAIVGYDLAADPAGLRTPFDDQTPVMSSYLHAAVVHDLLQQSWLRSPPTASVLLSLLIGGAALSGLLYQRPAWIKVTTTLGLSLGWLCICFIALRANYLLPVVAPVVAIALIGASVMLLGRLQSSAMLQARSAFLNTMSHEIRTPLNAIVNLSEMLQETSLDSRQHEFVDSLRNSSQTLLTLINDILDFSKIESERLVLEDYPVNLHEIIERSLEMLAPRAAEKNIELVYALTPQTPAVILSDPTRLQQILVNLLSNAVKFTEAGQISIEVEAAPRVPENTWRSRLIDALKLDALKLNASKRRIFYQVNQAFRRQSKQQIRMGRATVPPNRRFCDRTNSFYEIRFTVKDTGIGIPAEQISELFKPFSQVSPSTTRQYGGTGLGLAISQRLSELMGGRLWVKSQLGKGSTFYFSIRSHIAHPQPQLPKELLNLTGTQILLIDQNATRSARLKWELAPLGIHLESTRSLAHALAELQRQPPFDAVILDDAITSPDSASRTIKALRQAANHRHLPIILLSRLRSGVPNLGNTTVLWKPVKQSSLYQALQFVLVESRLTDGTGRGAAERNRYRRSTDTPPPSELSLTQMPLSAAPRSFPAADRLAISTADPESKLMLPLGHRPSADLRILIAEDNRINQRVALRMLELLGYKASIVTSGTAVLETLKHQPYDVILMDMRMPELNGIETTRLIRQMPQHQNIWIIAMTANTMAQDRERCLNAGMNDYLSKPIDREALNRALENCLTLKELG